MSKDHLDFTLVRAHEVRQRFTEYVLMNQNKALINTSLFQHDDSFFKKQSVRAHPKKKKKLGDTMTFKQTREGSKQQSSLYYVNQMTFNNEYGEEEESKEPAQSRRGRRVNPKLSTSMAESGPRRASNRGSRHFNNLNVSRDRSERSSRMSKNHHAGKLDR